MMTKQLARLQEVQEVYHDHYKIEYIIEKKHLAHMDNYYHNKIFHIINLKKKRRMPLNILRALHL